MNIEQSRWTASGGWRASQGNSTVASAQLLLLFGAGEALARRDLLSGLRAKYPDAVVLGCSTAGEICGTDVSDDSLVATAVEFEHTRIECARATIADPAESYAVGQRLSQSLGHDGLAHMFVLSDGLRVNGSELVKGLTDGLPKGVTVTGGLSGDGERFERTSVVLNGDVELDAVVGVGLYGDRLKVGYASLGGFDPFGAPRSVTRSKGNVLYELDGQPALELYKSYLGEYAKGLPATGLLFPLSVELEGTDKPLVRTILAVAEGDGSITFAGDVPEGSTVRLMKGSFDRLIDGAAAAARASNAAIGTADAQMAILVSCVGRKLLLKQRIEEEVEAVRDALGDQTVLTGFYSYGEISPFTPDARCELHNQTMAITTFSE